MNRWPVDPFALRSHIPRASRESFLPVNLEEGALFDNWGIRSAGISELTAGYARHRRDCSFSLLIGVLGGEGTCLYEGETHALKKGCLFLQRVGSRQLYWTSGSWNIIWFHLDKERWDQIEEPFSLTPRSEEISSLHETMGLYIRESRLGSAAMISTLGELIYHMIRRLTAPSGLEPRDRSRRLIEDLRRRVLCDPALAWTNRDLADSAGITPSYLYKLTARILNCTPGEMVRDIRMDQARHLLTYSDYPLKFIAQRIGYATPYAFSKSFRKNFGISPGAFRGSPSEG